jgi:S1-C subfamily serine protease
VNLFDLLVVVTVLAAALGGYQIGFVARVASWLGLGAGLLVAVRVAPPLLEALDPPDPGLRMILAVGTFLLIASLGATIGEFGGAKLRRLIPPGPSRVVDRAAGAVAGGFGILVLLWLLLPSLAEVPGELSAQVRDSVIARAVDRASPSVPESLRALRNLVRNADFPQVFDSLRPPPSGGPPPPSGVLDEAVEARVAASTVKIRGVACNRVLEGSGFAAGPDLVATNAHVVAGVDRPSVLRPDGQELRGRVVVFDPDRDLALISVANLGQTPLPVGTASVGDEGAVFGHPRGQIPLEVSPARIVDRRQATGLNIYGSDRARREVFFLAAELQPGDSGGALIDQEGTVVGVAFAIDPSRPDVAYALTDDELSSVLDLPRGEPVDTGPCLR